MDVRAAMLAMKPMLRWGVDDGKHAKKMVVDCKVEECVDRGEYESQLHGAR